MSRTNPFRRNDRCAEQSSTISDSGRRDRPGADRAISLPSLKVEVPTSASSPSITTKRVRIASPPVPISPETPASYGSSPDVTRCTSSLASPPPRHSPTVARVQPLPVNPFQSSWSEGEEDDVDEELLENTRHNSAHRSPEETGDDEKSDTVRETMARSAASSRWPAASAHDAPDDQVQNTSSRPPLDVDGFKRLLLTGKTGEPPAQSSQDSPPQPLSNSGSGSSTADTASVSQPSFSASQTPANLETPRTSSDLDREYEVGETDEGNGMGDQEQLIAPKPYGVRKRPPLAKPQGGKPLHSGKSCLMSSLSPGKSPDRPMVASLDPSPSNLHKPLPRPPVDNSFPSDGPAPGQKTLSTPTPPPPPLSRRPSQQKSRVKQESMSSSRSHLARLYTHEPARAATTAPPPPPPPPPPPTSPSRQQKSQSRLLAQAATSNVQEAARMTNDLQSRPSSGADPTVTTSPPPRPPLSRNPSTVQRKFQTASDPSKRARPPRPPPPRRGRGSSLGSSDNPQVTMPPDEPDKPDEGEVEAEAKSRPYAGHSTAEEKKKNERGCEDDEPRSTDILADLATLQTEVDALRKKQEHGA